ncbi:MAG: hypothetical protein JXA74_13450, partial [Anaerolineae bacterium]|nr:hypothetical protein [Anaerolineae bacterium]
MKRRVLCIDALRQSWHLEALRADAPSADPREDYGPLSGEALCQYILRRSPQALVIARGPMPFLSGNKTTVGYISPLTGFPHYSLVGGRSAAQLLSRGLDAICLPSPERGATSGDGPLAYIMVEGYAPDLQVHFHPADELPLGQRSAYYWLMQRELGGQAAQGAIFTIGRGARLGYASANLAVDAIYHAGRGGAGQVLARHAAALVLRGDLLDPRHYFALESSPAIDTDRARSTFVRHPNASVSALLERHCARLSAKTGGTIAKLYATGADPTGKHTLPSANARQVGYALADLGSPQVLRQTRQGQTGCQWCQVDCRHYHWVPADYAPEGRDMLLDDFEPTYAIYAML